MSVQVRSRRESAAFLATYVGAQGELLVDTTNNRIQVHDGATPGGAPAAKLSEVVTNTRTAVADAAYTVLATDRTIAVTSLTAARTITLPAASTYPTGTQLLVFDESGACSASNAIGIARAGSDTINGATSATIATAYGYLAFESNGAARWTIVDQTAGVAAASASRTPIADISYTATASDRLIGYTSITAARTVTLPAASAYPVGTRLLVVDESGSASSTSTITLAQAGGDTINGGASAAISSAYGYIAVQSNGAAKWTITDQPGASSGGAATPRTPVADANYTALASDRLIAYTTLSAARTVTLPAASAFPQGVQLFIVDESGSCSATVTITIARAGTDTINGAASAASATAFGYLALESNGSGKWTIVDQAPSVSGLAAPPPSPQGRLTLTSGAPVLTSTVTGATSVLYTPHVGNLVGLWNGTTFVGASFTEISQALSDATKSPSAAAAGQVYDLFAWSDSGMVRVTRGPAWSAGATAGSNAVRGSGAGSTALARVNGVLVNAVAITNGPAAGYGTYVGTIATDAGGATVSFNTGTAAAGGGAATIGVWNAYNRVPVGGSVRDTTASWSYASAAWRGANGMNVGITFVTGQADDTWTGAYNSLTSAGSSSATTGVGVDTTAAFTGSTGWTPSGSANASRAEAQVILLGKHTMTPIEYSSGGTMNGQGTAGVPTWFQSGFVWSGRY